MSKPEIPDWLRGSEMGELIHAHDWTESGLGLIQTWPSNLKFAVNIVLLLPSPAMLFWGPKLIQIYNDRCRDWLGTEHPACLGQPVSEFWPEVWDFLAPVCEGVMRRRESFIFDNHPLTIKRNGILEERFFKLTYSPIPGDLCADVSNHGGADASMPGGVFVTVNDTTESVRARALEAERIRLEEALQAKRIQLLEEVFRHAPSFLYVLKGPEFIFEFANEAFYQLVGHRDLVGQPAFEALPEAAHDGIQHSLMQVMASGKPFVGFEQPVIVVRSPGGQPEERFIDVSYVPLLDENGACQYILGHGIDVTAHVQNRKNAENALRESEERFRGALQSDTVGIIFLDTEGRIIEANDAFLTMSGFSREDEKAGRLRCDAMTPPEWTSVSLRAIEEFKATGRTTPYEKEFFRKDGSRWWALLAAKQLNEHEAVEYVIDITRRKRIEQSLRESEARFRAMAEASPALTWQVDAQGDAVYLNQRFMDMTGVPVSALMHGGWHSIIHPDDMPDYMAAFEQAMRERSRFQRRVRIKTAQGEWRWLESYALPWFTAADEYAGHVGISIDITDTVNAETSLRETDRRKDEFLATLAHELRNPLAPISNALALIARPDGITALPRLLPVINRQVNYMIRLVDDLLEISRITSGKIELRPEPIALASVLRNAVEASMPLINEKGHKLSVFIPEAPLIVLADVVRLEQVFTNLLNNAVRYTKQGGQIWLTARQEGESAVISVRDNGIGILAGMLPRLFDMFAQERRNGIGAQEGLGIGLNLVYRLLQMHGGTIEAISEGMDRGSEFIVRLPLSEGSSRGKSTEPEKAALPPQGLRILVVDDNHDAAEVLSMLLESIGVNVRVVNSGLAALAVLPDYRPNIILMDIGMPGMNGYEVARRIREQPQYNDIKIIALTGWGQEEDRRQSEDAGFDHHLTKPVDFKLLKELIASL
ncbi:hybrid sensor histidine kinase/response regulator [Nitrosospira lacus]|uniref:histidine kinase n=1 Tax=Nitrosospira lacus TaxID=1288494 RepID=A0A1W6SPR1_9PROT|nr:PAS domain S-box protein [Nitrosospira lacus]ARO87798.1 hybrid sensor histidine kinase/response regulator [Nitrosospira lacus]